MRRTRRRRAVLHAGFAALLLGLWAAVARSPGPLPGPGAVLGELIAQTESGALPAALANAAVAVALGFGLATVVGVPVGLAMGVSADLRSLLDPLLTAVYVTPIAALVPALIVWFSTGLLVRVVVVFLFAVFPIAVNAMEGARTVPEDLLDAARSFGADRRFLLFRVVLPHEAASVVTGLRLGVGRAVKGLVVAELLVSVTGIGHIITSQSAALDVAGVLAPVFVLMGVGVVLTAALRAAERRLFPWAGDRGR